MEIVYFVDSAGWRRAYGHMAFGFGWIVHHPFLERDEHDRTPGTLTGPWIRCGESESDFWGQVCHLSPASGRR